MKNWILSLGTTALIIIIVILFLSNPWKQKPVYISSIDIVKTIDVEDIDKSQFPQLYKTKLITILEAQINFDQAKKERDDAVEEVAASLNKPELAQMILLAKKLRETGALSAEKKFNDFLIHYMQTPNTYPNFDLHRKLIDLRLSRDPLSMKKELDVFLTRHPKKAIVSSGSSKR